ncbi:MAG: DUF2905 domain-containing protein [bacterium]|nr:DUF2905 domain-containing protein [bacterium]
MNTLTPIGRLLIISGIILVIIGLLTIYGSRIPFIGRLPGDIYIKRDNFTFYFPLASSIVVSIILTLILFLISKFTR